jgi:hypothetical protein
LNNRSVPYLVSELTGKFVESLTCGQSQVIAICADGSAYNWGFPIDALNMSAIEFAMIDKSAFNSRPVPISSFTKNRRARQISCGRKHYLLVTKAVYGPNCFLLISQNPVSVDQELNFDAGNSVKIIIQACDDSGSTCVSGGSLVSGIITQRLTESTQTTNEKSIVHHNLVIDDDLDGKYSSRFRLNVAGLYDMSVTIDGLHISGSPFVIKINQLEPSMIKSFVTCNSTDALGLNCFVGDILQFRIHLRDDFDNEVNPTEIFLMGIDCVTADGALLVRNTADSVGNVCLKIDHIGCYTLRSWIKSEYNRIKQEFNLFVYEYTKISSDDCSFSVPKSVIAGCTFRVHINLKAKTFSRNFDSKLFSDENFISPFKSLTKSSCYCSIRRTI